MEEYSSHIAKHDAVWQAKLDNMTADYNKISEYGARNEAELEVLRVYRVGVEKSVKASEEKVIVLEDSLRKADEKAKKMSEAICATLQAYEAE
jgi:hypothetical protein